MRCASTHGCYTWTLFLFEIIFHPSSHFDPSLLISRQLIQVRKSLVVFFSMHQQEYLNKLRNEKSIYQSAVREQNESNHSIVCAI